MRTRDGVGEKASSTSSSESRISSISMKRPDPFGGVDGNRCGVCCGEINLRDVGGADTGTAQIPLFAFGGLPRRFLGEPEVMASADADADADSVDVPGGGLCSILGGADWKSSISAKLVCDSTFWFDGGGWPSSKSSMSSKIPSCAGRLGAGSVKSFCDWDSGGVGRSDEIAIGTPDSMAGPRSSMSTTADDKLGPS